MKIDLKKYERLVEEGSVRLVRGNEAIVIKPGKDDEADATYNVDAVTVRENEAIVESPGELRYYELNNQKEILKGKRLSTSAAGEWFEEEIKDRTQIREDEKLIEGAFVMFQKAIEHPEGFEPESPFEEEV